MTGIYIHVPFCERKCPYCAFYSRVFSSDAANAYVGALAKAVAGADTIRADTLYFGGGTPALLGTDNIIALTDLCRQRFGLDNAEMTLECNPNSISLPALEKLRQAGVNRLSVGVQSLDDGELRFLGRLHDSRQALQAFSDARRAGFENLSADLMIGIKGQTEKSISDTVKTLTSLGALHLSVYMIKVEQGTAFDSDKIRQCLMDDDELADLYLAAVSAAGDNGLKQYEISNFAAPGYESRHNSKYWEREEYLGFGPCAASDFAGRRFTIEPDLEKYIAGIMNKGVILSESELIPLRERAGEYLMLRLRTVDGIEENEYTRSFLLPFAPLEEVLEKCRKEELAEKTGPRWHLTPRGFMVSNSIMVELLEAQQNSRPLAQKL